MNLIPKICLNCVYYCESGYCRIPDGQNTDEQVSEDFTCNDIEIIKW